MPFLFQFVFGLAMLVPAICLVVGIIQLKQASRQFKHAVPLVATASSFCWVLLALIWHGAFGPEYSVLRYAIIGTNMIGTLTAGVASAAIRSQRSWPTVPAALILAFVWLYIGVINSAAG